MSMQAISPAEIDGIARLATRKCHRGDPVQLLSLPQMLGEIGERQLSRTASVHFHAWQATDAVAP